MAYYNYSACCICLKGEPLRDVTYPVHTVSQATALCWHPDRRQLVAGWENGELNAWSAGHRTFTSISATHKSPIVHVGFSEQGGRMVTADSVSRFIHVLKFEYPVVG